MSLSQFFVRDADDAADYNANLACKSALLTLTYAVNPN
jgi:hypothetical protein